MTDNQAVPTTKAGKTMAAKYKNDLLDQILAIENEAVEKYLASPDFAERLARALSRAEVGCWANPPHHSPSQDEQVHKANATDVQAALVGAE